MLRTILIVAVAVVASGCRVDPYAEVREREWRRLEDEIYHREGIIADLEARLESCRRENDALRRRRGVDEPSEPLPPPKDESPAEVPPEAIEDFRPPKTELGTEAPPPLGRSAPRGARRVRLAGGMAAAEGRGSAKQTFGLATQPARSDALPATSLKFNRRLTGGNDTDGRAGDEGILAVVEVRDVDGRFVASPGPISLAVYDPLASGDHSVVARWDFAAEEVAARFREGPFGSGIHFELPWPNHPPRRSELRLEARCQTAGGKSLSATHRISVALPQTGELVGPGHGPQTGEMPPWRPTRP